MPPSTELGKQLPGKEQMIIIPTRSFMNEKLRGM